MWRAVTTGDWEVVKRIDSSYRTWQLALGVTEGPSVGTNRRSR